MSADQGPHIQSVEERLGDVGHAVRRAMLEAIPDGEPHAWLYRVAREYPARTGKALRPALLLATAQAFGAKASDAFPVAVAVELLHNAFLVHDDIVDGSERRRGLPTLSAQYGTAVALNAGDALAVLANRVVRKYGESLPAHLCARLLDEFDTMALRTLEGQATELGWQRDGTHKLAPEDYLDLVMHKTCWYTAVHPMRVGALIGSEGRADLDPMVRFGFHLGSAFQIRDDLLNLEGNEGVYGKELDGDLFEGKRTLPLIHLANNARGADLRTVERYLALSRATRSPELVATIHELMVTHGSLEFARAYAEGIADTARLAFEVAFADVRATEHAQFVHDLIPYMLERQS